MKHILQIMRQQLRQRRLSAFDLLDTRIREDADELSAPGRGAQRYGQDPVDVRALRKRLAELEYVDADDDEAWGL